LNARADAFNFVEPVYLWLLVIPAALLLGWTWMLLKRRADARRAARTQVLPREDESAVHGRYAAVGDLPFWLAVLVAASLCVVAVARPYIVVWESTTAGADFVILQDGSSSMYVRDVAPDRWQRSMRFLRAFAETLSWKDDRVGLALFAYFAAPQLRLTKDPEPLFFFLDHLAEQSPFRLEDDPTWNTNIEEGITWGLRLIETNEKLFGRTNHPKAFVVISDGQAWSGKVESALAAARAADVAVYVVGVGTTAGGYIPATSGRTARASGIYSVLDRDSLRDIARAAAGDYFELGRQPDRDIASRIISAVRRRAPVAPREETRQELYWPLLIAAAAVLCGGTLVLRNRTEVFWYAAAALAAIVLLARAL
jgi:Ca-activated chloride channel family protein